VSQKLYVSNLPFQITEDDLKSHFLRYGEVISTVIVKDRDTGRSRGFGFVEMENGEKAIAEGNGSTLDGRTLTVSQAREREQRPRYSR